MSALAPVSYEPIRLYKVLGTVGQPVYERYPEDATQTFKMGVPVRFVAGMIQECSFAAADVVVGVTGEPSHNLTTANTGQSTSEGAPQNQPNAVIIPGGAWPKDGKIGAYHADDTNVFSVALKAGQVFVQTLIIPGTLYRLIKDGTTGFWYLDNTLTGGNAGVAQLLGVDPSCPNTAADGSRVFFMFASGTQRYY